MEQFEQPHPSSPLSGINHDRWLMAEGPTKRSYLVHTQHPRFIAEIVDRRTTNGDHNPIVGLDKDCALINFNWFDPRPHGDQLHDLLKDATDAVLEDDAITASILDSMLHSENKNPESGDGFSGLN
jgi:hypothetical protein